MSLRLRWPSGIGVVGSIFVLSLLASQSQAFTPIELDDCPLEVVPDSTTAALVESELGITFVRYLPSSSVAPLGSMDVQFTYSSGILSDASTYNGNVTALQADLDAFAAKLADEIDNPLGIQTPDLGIIHDLFHVTAYRSYAYGDSSFADPANGGGRFRIDQRHQMQLSAGERDSSSVGPPAAYNHVDIVIVKGAELIQLGMLENAQLGELSHIVNFPSDVGEDPAHVGVTYDANGVIITGVPTGPEWSGYHVVIHELGHVFDYSSILKGGGLYHEPRANVARAYCGNEASVHGGNGYPFNRGFFRTERFPAGEPFKWDPGANPGVQAYDKGEFLFSYLAENLNGGTLGDVSDDLAVEFLSRSEVDVSGLHTQNGSFWAFGDILGDELYDDAEAYPYLQDAESDPLSGDERWAIVFHNMAIAITVNAPSIEDGQFGFPYKFVPTEDYRAWEDVTVARSEVAAPVEVLASDFGVTRTVPNPYVFPAPDNSSLPLDIHPWNHEAFVFNLADGADSIGIRELEILVRGDGVPWSSGSSSYYHEVRASLVLFSDLDGGSIHTSPELALGVVPLDPRLVGGDLEFMGIVPSYAGAKHAVLVLTMGERNPPQYADENHPWYDQTYTPWSFDLEYTLRDRSPSVTFEDETTSSGLATSGTPYAASFRDYSISDDPAFAVSREDAATIHYRRTGVASGVPQHQNEALTVGFQNTSAERGLASADYDSDGDIDLFVAHASAPRLYNFDASRTPKYLDVSTTTAAGDSTLRALTLDSWSGSWADYDGDGHLDLYVTRAEAPSTGVSHSPASIDDKGLKDVLLRNRGYAGVGFDDVTVAAGLHDADSETVSASWADIDNDGDLDLYVSWLGAYHDSPLGWSPLYRNDGDGTFTDITYPAAQVPYVSGAKFTRLGFVNASAWGDLNSDGFLDIALARQNTSGQGILQNVKVYINQSATTPGDLSGEPAGLPSSTVSMRDLRIHDLDNNTKPDLIYTPVGTETEQIYMGYQTPGNEVWVDQAAALGVTGASGRAIMAADLNGDGDIDLYLGRGSSQATYFQNRAADGGEAPTNNFLRVALQNHAVAGGTWNSGNAVEGISARVLVECPASGELPAWKQSLVMDGGTGLGGQDDRLLNVGLGQYEAGTVTVYWPDGATTQSTFDSGDINDATPLYVADVHSPGLNSGSVDATAQPQVGAEQVWVFEWKTAFTTNEALDRVVLRPKPNKNGIVPPACVRDEITLTPSDPDVTHTVTVDGTSLLHRLEWEADWCDAECSYTFDVYSKLGDSEDQKLLTTITVPLCIQ